MAQTIETLLRENIHGVFSEPDAEKRRNNIARLWAEDGVFIDPDSRYEGIQALNSRPQVLPKGFPTSSLPSAAKFRHTTESASSIGDSAPLERKPLSLVSTCS
jgi:hypothetical protein